MKTRFLLLLFTLCSGLSLTAQIGGENAFEMMSLPVSSRAMAQGGSLLSIYDNDAGLALGNPSLLTHQEFDRTMHVGYSPYFAGTHFAAANYVHRFKPATFQFGTRFFTIGNVEERDPVNGNLGLFTANEIALTAGAGYQYDRFHFGANTHLLFGQMAEFTSLAMAFDLSAMYVDTNRLFSVGLLLKNAGFMMKTYTPGNQELLPFDVQIALSKSLKKLPFRFNLTIHNLYRWDIRYDDPNAQSADTDLFGQEDDGPGKAGIFFDNLARHLIFGGEFTIKKVFYVGFAYNHLRRKELALATRGGFSGFSFGMGLGLKRWGVQYGFGKYHLAGAGHQFGFQFNFLRGS